MFAFRTLVVARKGQTLRSFATATSVASSKAFSIPIIDFSKFKQARSSADRQETAGSIVSAFKESGFIYLAGHGIPSGAFRVYRNIYGC